MQYDVIITGGGLGGLTAGAKLAKEGKKVLLIEQRHIPGGCATTFRRKDFIIEVSLAEMDGLDADDLKIEIFRDLGVFDHVEFLKIPEFYRFTNERVDIVIPNNYGKAIEVLIRHFPDEENGIKKFFKVILKIRREIKNTPREKWKQLLLLPVLPILYPRIIFNQNKTLGNFLDKLIKNEELKLVLQANLQYYHDNPHTMSLLYFAVAQASYFSGGGHYVKGGSQKLSDYLARFIKDNGGEVILGHLTTKIMTENNKANGVEYKKTHDMASEIKKDFARFIIANAAIPNVANELLPAEAGKQIKAKIERLEISFSHLAIYLCFKKPIKELGNKDYSTFVFDKSVLSQADLIKNYRGNFSKRNFSFVDYSQIDSGLAPKGKSVGAIFTADYISDWENLSIEEYKAKKERVAQILTERLNRVCP